MGVIVQRWNVLPAGHGLCLRGQNHNYDWQRWPSDRAGCPEATKAMAQCACTSRYAAVASGSHRDQIQRQGSAGDQYHGQLQGKDSQGRLTMNFGPINKDGGERRLNVIVTRAKEKTVLVTSIKASDFNLNDLNSEGVRHLYHYLDYAER